jgi:undecaprenyl-diphosphatase
MRSADWEVFKAINDQAGRFWILDKLSNAFVNDYLVPVGAALVLFSLWFWGRERSERERNQWVMVHAALSVGLAVLAVDLLNAYYFRDRPFVNHEVNLLFYQPTDSSFPSNPAAVVFAVAAAVGMAHPRLGAGVAALGLCQGLARVYAGVCYPLDVLGGAGIGVGAAIAAYVTLRLLEPLPQAFLGFWRGLYLA